MIEVKTLTKQYGSVTAVDDVSFSVGKGQTLALVGTSGSGKTTILKMINRLIEPTSGSIKINGKSVWDQPVTDLRRQMGYVIQNTGLFPHYTIAENIGLVPSLLKQPKTQIFQRIHSLMERLSLDPALYADKYPHQLSGGQQQRAGIARALAADPPIVLMDEPFGALDPLTRKDIRNDFRNLEEWKTKTVILVTHDVEEAFELGDLVCLLDSGKIQQLGTPEQLLYSPGNEFVAQFLADKYTSLQLRTTLLSDIAGEWKSQEHPLEKYPILAPGTTVQAALDELLQKGSPQANTNIGGKWYHLNLNQIMEGLQNRITE